MLQQVCVPPPPGWQDSEEAVGAAAEENKVAEKIPTMISLYLLQYRIVSAENFLILSDCRGGRLY